MIEYNKWIKCTDENYWQSDRDIVAVPIDVEVFYFSRSECPYGWNVLCNCGAMFFTPIEADFHNGN